MRMMPSDDAAAGCGCRARTPRAPPGGDEEQQDAGRDPAVDLDAGFLQRILHDCARGPVQPLDGVGGAARAPPGLLPERPRPPERSRCRRRAPRPTIAAIAVHGIRPVEERRDRDLVGAAQHRRCASPGPARRRRRAAGTGRHRHRGLERELAERGPVDGAERLVEPGRRAQREADREAHVGHRELGDGRAVDELDHPVDRPTAGARPRRSGRRRRRTARGPRSPRGPCS